MPVVIFLILLFVFPPAAIIFAICVVLAGVSKKK